VSVVPPLILVQEQEQISNASQQITERAKEATNESAVSQSASGLKKLSYVDGKVGGDRSKTKWICIKGEKRHGNLCPLNIWS
jgi:hypothetical protein